MNNNVFAIINYAAADTGRLRKDLEKIAKDNHVYYVDVLSMIEEEVISRHGNSHWMLLFVKDERVRVKKSMDDFFAFIGQ